MATCITEGSGIQSPRSIGQRYLQPSMKSIIFIFIFSLFSSNVWMTKQVDKSIKKTTEFEYRVFNNSMDSCLVSKAVTFFNNFNEKDSSFSSFSPSCVKNITDFTFKLKSIFSYDDKHNLIQFHFYESDTLSFYATMVHKANKEFMTINHIDGHEESITSYYGTNDKKQYSISGKDSVTTIFRYNEQGRLILESDASDSVIYIYNKKGNVIEQIGSNDTLKIEYLKHNSYGDWTEKRKISKNKIIQTTIIKRQIDYQ